MDLAQLTNAPREMTLCGVVYKVSALKQKEWGEIQAWIKDHVPSPLSQLDSANLENLSAQDRRILLDLAYQEQKNFPPRPGTRQWFDAIDSDDGRAMFLKVVLGKHQPDFTVEQARAMAESLTIGEVMPLVMRALGIEDDRPKGGTANGSLTDVKMMPPATTPANSSSS